MRVRIAVLLAVLATVVALLPSPAGSPVAEATIRISGPIRVLRGDTLEVMLDGHRTAIGLIGVAAPSPKTACGRDASALLKRLVRGGIGLDEDRLRKYDARHRRLSYASTSDGRPIALLLVRAGVVHANGQGRERQRLAIAQAEAKAAQRGCLWSSDRTANGIGAAPPPPVRGAQARSATSLPDGFLQDVVVSGLTEPTTFALLPDGRILIAEKRGVVRVFKNGALLATPLIDISDHVNDYWDHGLLGIATDPQFASNGFLYLKYTYENDPNDYSDPKTGRLTRVTVVGDTAAPSSEVTILGIQVGTPCDELPAGADCLPGDGPSHEGGAIFFAPDGSMFVTTGDGSNFTIVDPESLRAQNVDSLAGKLLRISPTGTGLPDNPFWNGDPTANRSKVWAYGFRNPFRATLKPGTSVPYVANVGWYSWEAIDVATPGANFGWPCYEGPGPQDGFGGFAQCQALQAVRPALFEYPHTSDLSASVTGGAFYTGATFPSLYQGAYFYGDYVRGTLRYLRVDDGNQVVLGDGDFATNADGPVAIQMGPDNGFYYLSIFKGEVRRISYVPSASLTSCPTGQYFAEYFANATLDGPPAFQRCETAIDTTWAGVGPGNGLDPQNFSVRWTGQVVFAGGTYTFTARSTDGARVWLDGTALIDTWTNVGQTSAERGLTVVSGQHEVKVEYHHTTGDPAITVSWQLVAGTNRLPAATILAPATAPPYKVGDVITFQGSASDPEDGALPPSGLAWQIILHHCPNGSCHVHTLVTAAGASGTFTVPDHGDDGYLELVLTATDSGGLTGTASVTLRPQYVHIALATQPDGLRVVYNGAADTAPYTRTTIAGSAHTIYVPSPQAAVSFQFWSDGGAQQHDVILGTADATFMATFQGAFVLTASAPNALPSTTPATIVASALSQVSGTSRIEVQIFSPTGDRVFTQSSDPEPFTPGTQWQFPATWQPATSAPAGAYVVALAAYDAQSGALQAFNPSAAQITLTGIPPPIDGGERQFFPFLPQHAQQ